MNKEDLRKYFCNLHEDLGEQFQHVAEVSDECFEDIWHETDHAETGFVTWHQIKNFCARVLVHEAELAEERKIKAEAEAKKLEEKRLREEAEEAARVAEEER